MTSLNVEIPVEVMEQLRLAKLLTKRAIREIAREAIQTWLDAHGMTPEKIKKLRGK